jgi:hypothetical protein
MRRAGDEKIENRETKGWGDYGKNDRQIGG